jgi:DNA-directed RNA polymerase specialized sigma24 family protein
MEPIPADLLVRLRQGDHQAFRAVCAPSLDSCYSLAVSECRGDEVLAREVTRAGLMLAWVRVGAAFPAQDPGDFRIWLLAIVRHEGRNRMRKKKKLRALEMPSPLSPSSGQQDARASFDSQVVDAVLLDTAFMGMTSNEREILDLTIRQGLDTDAALRVMGGTTQEAPTLVAQAKEKFELTVAAAVLFEHGPPCPERVKDVGSDRGLNPLTRQRLMRHLQVCPTCAPSRGIACEAIANLGVPLLVAPPDLYDDLFELPPEASSSSSPIAAGPQGDVSYLGLGPAGLAPLSIWEQAKRLDKARAANRSDGWPPAKQPGRVRRLFGKAVS